MFRPLDDGITHINVYSRGRTEIGRLLSNFAHTPFEHPDHGHFESVEGFWYWLLTDDDELRELYGFTAKKKGKEIIQTYGTVPYNGCFETSVKIAIQSKLAWNASICDLLRRNSLPLTHYYVIGKPEDNNIKQAGGEFMLEEIDRLRKLSKYIFGE